MQRTIRSYVLRAGRMTHRQREGLEQWLGNYCLAIDDNLWDLPTVFGRDAKTIVEIGFGMGSSLFLTAQEHPQINFIGIEVHRAGIGSLAADLHTYNVNNVRIAPYDATEIFQKQFAENSLAGVHIFFPDPWPKKKHHKRRLIQPDFIKRVARVLQPGGIIHCATDWQDYAEHMLMVLESEQSLCNQNEKGSYSPRPSTRPVTKFEQRGKRLGHDVRDLVFYKRQ